MNTKEETNIETPMEALAASSPPLLEVRQVSVHFGGVQAFADMIVALQPGEIVLLVDANGAGKTTTRRAASRTCPRAVAPSATSRSRTTSRSVPIPWHHAARSPPASLAGSGCSRASASCGEQQMSAIARAPMSRPRLLMCDGPLARTRVRCC